MPDSHFYELLYKSSNPIRRWLHISRRELVHSYLDTALVGRPSSSAIEVGFGDGSYLEYMLKYTTKVCGFDYCNALITNGQKKFGNRVAFVNGDVRNYKMTQKFDLILCTEMLEHIRESQAALLNMADWLAPGGILILTTPNKYSILEICARLIKIPLLRKIIALIYREAIHDLEHVGLRTETELRLYFECVGLEVISTKNVGLYIPIISECFPFSFSVSIFSKIQTLLQRTVFRKILWTQAYYLRNNR